MVTFDTPIAPPGLITAETVLGFGWKPAVDALEMALLGGLDPEADPLRTRVAVHGFEMLFMPSQLRGWTGAKLLTVRPDNAAQGISVVQGVYVLFDAGTGSPAAILDGAALTALRTAAVSALAVRHLATGPLDRLVLFGSGVQAKAHAYALLATTTVGRIEVVGRVPERVAALVADLQAHGVEARAAAPDAVVGADAVVCTTASPTPLFEGTAVAPEAVVVAIGSHTPDTREVDSTLVARSHIVIESRQSALRENGDVLLPLAEGAVTESDLHALAALVRGEESPAAGRPRLFTGTGMPWQDLVVAAAVVAQTATTRSNR